MKKLLILYPFLLFCLISKADNQLKLTNWEIKSTTEISENAEKVSMPSFQATDWYEATVPTTVLNALVKQNVYPDPRIGMNNFLIPDVSDEFNKKMDLAKYSYLGNGKNPWQYLNIEVLPRISIKYSFIFSWFSFCVCLSIKSI